MTYKTKDPEKAHKAQVIITGRHVQITDAMKAYVLEKLAKLDHLSDRIIEIQVTMETGRGEHKVTIQLKVNNFMIKSHAVTNDMYASIDEAVHRLERQLVTYKQRLHDYRHRPVQERELDVQIVRAPREEDLDVVNEDIEEENFHRIEESLRPHAIIRTEKRPLKLLTRAEAIMKMELSHDEFLVYREESKRQLEILYRLEDGEYGIIQLES